MPGLFRRPPMPTLPRRHAPALKPPSGTAYQKTASDTISSVSDSVGRQTTHGRGNSDTLSSLTEAMARVSAKGRTTADSIASGITEAVTRITGKARTTADAISSASEAAVRAVGLNRTSGDSMASLAEAIARVSAKIRTAADSFSNPYVKDLFQRSVGTGWGTADVGGTWSTDNSAELSVSGGYGVHTFAAAGSANAEPLSTSFGDAEGTLRWSWNDISGSGNTVYTRIQLRIQNGGADHVRFEVRHASSGSVGVLIRKQVTSVLTTLDTNLGIVTGYSNNAWLNFRWQTQVSGADLIFRYRLWKDGDSEPSWYEYTAVSIDSVLLNSGTLEIVSQDVDGSVPAGRVASYDDLNIGPLGGSLAEAVTRITGKARTAADAVSSLSEAPARILALIRSVADSGFGTLTEAVVGVKNGGVTQYFLTAADALSTLADSVARGAAAKTRATTDALSSLSEVASRVLGFLRTSADSLSSGSIVRQSYQTGGGVPSGAGPYTHTVTYPSGVTVDDYLVLNIGFNGGPGTVSLAADGWTLMASAVGQTNPDFYMYGRKATAAWSGDFTYTTSNGIYTGYILARYSGVDTSTPQDTTAVGTDGAQATTYNLTGITTATNGAMLVVGVAANSSTGARLSVTADEPVTEYAEINQDSAIKDTMAADGIKATAGATGTIDGGITQSLTWAGVVGALRPASGGGGISEAVVRAAMNKSRTSADALASVAEAIVRAVAQTRSISDTLGSLAEVIARITGKARTASDTVTSFAESAVRAAGNRARTTADALGSVADSVARSAPAVRAIGDALGSLSEGVAGLKVIARSAVDALGSVSELVSRSSSKARTTADALGTLQEAAARAAAAKVRSTSDTVAALAEAAARAAAAKVRTVPDALTSVSEAVVRGVMNRVRTTADAIASVVESPTAARGWIRSTTDALASVSESVVRSGYALVRSSVDALASVTESVVRGAIAFIRREKRPSD